MLLTRWCEHNITNQLELLLTPTKATKGFMVCMCYSITFLIVEHVYLIGVWLVENQTTNIIQTHVITRDSTTFANLID